MNTLTTKNKHQTTYMKTLITMIATFVLTLPAFAGRVPNGGIPGCDLVIPTICGVSVGTTLPPLPEGWHIVAAADFNADGYPDLFLFNEKTGEHVIWYLHAE